jgi:CRP-like cAMP-binding protein
MPVTKPGDNRILAALSADELERLAPDLGPVTLDIHEELAGPADDLEYVYFPTSALVSILHSMEDRRSIEVGSVGRDGMVGLRSVLGNGHVKQQFIAQVPGEAYRLPLELFAREAKSPGPLHTLVLRYASALLYQQSQWVACSVLHTVEQRCCRWLLMVHDRTGRDQFPLTHEFLAQMLGVRRASVTEVARGLQKAGLIAYRRGEMNIVDLPALEKAACECYRRVKAEYSHLMP